MSLMSERYNCLDCDKEWLYEKIRRHHDFPPKPACPICGGKNTHRRWGAPIINVKQGKVGNAKDGYTGKNYVDKAQQTLKKVKDTGGQVVPTGDVNANT